MIPIRQMLYCVVASGTYLLVVSLALDWVERKLQLTAALPEKMVEKDHYSGMLVNFALELVFYVAFPAVVYGFFYYLLPFYGVRAGMATALFAFAMGAVPALLGLSLKINLPTPFVFFTMLAFLVKLLGSLAIIGYLYTL
ncbi:MAG: hypothetical protein AB1772_09415 [Candidatus Zixiibacteriota bacterium]